MNDSDIRDLLAHASSLLAIENPRRSTLILQPPPTNLISHVFGFVHRDDLQGGQVVRLLPEVRTSIQIFLADPCFVREQSEHAEWRKLPRIGLWGPRYAWGYGFVQRHIRVYALGLTPIGMRALWPESAASLVNQVIDLGDMHAALAAQLAPTPNELFDAWQARVGDYLHGYFQPEPEQLDPLRRALDSLATSEGPSVAEAAAIAGMSERQFRRVFAHRLGVSPKHYQRAVRVDRLLRLLHAHPWEGDKFADQPIAFADQPHAIREFRAMTGMTPGQYLRAKHWSDATIRSVPVEGMTGPAIAYSATAV